MYIRSLRDGVDPNMAKILAALQFDTTAAVDPNQANLATLKTQDAKDAYNLYIAAGQDMATAKAIAEGVDEAAAAQGTGTQVAGTGTAAPFVPFSELSQVYPPRGGETELGQSGDTGQIGVSGEKPVGVLTQAEIDQYRKEGISEEDIQKAIGQYGMAPDITNENPVIQDLINSLFTGSKPAKTVATTTTPSIPTTPGTSTTPGATTAPSTTPSTGTIPTGTATDTTGVPGTSTTTSGGAPTGEAPSGGTGTGTATTGGATPGTGTGAGGTGTAGTGTTGTGTGGGGTGGGSGAGIGGVGIGGGYSSWQALQGQDQYGGIKNLTPGLTQRSDYTLSGLPTDSDEDTVNPMMNVEKLATGGSTTNTYDPFSTKDVSGSGISGSLVPGLSKAQINYILSGLPGNQIVPGKAEGGSIPGHSPEFYSEGGLSSMENRYVEGEGDGTSDEVPAMLANGEFVIPADVVSKLGNGSNEAGAGVLDQFLTEIRKHAHSNGEKLPPDSKGPLGYLLDAKRKVKA